MEALVETVQRYASLEQLAPLLRALAALLIALLLSRLVRRAGRTGNGAASPRQVALLRSLGSWLVLGLGAAWALRELGFDLAALLGAAGLLSVAVGFAAQTSVSNLISGVFLLLERPFAIGDVVEIDGTQGEVVSVDLMSVKIRRFDNLMVRIPNETMLKSKLSNLTHYPIRRYDLNFGVAYATDLERLRETLLAVAEANPLCLSEPPPLIIFTGFADSAVTVQFSTWCRTDRFLELINSITVEVKEALDAAGIEIPYPQRTVHLKGPLPPSATGVVGAAARSEAEA